MTTLNPNSDVENYIREKYLGKGAFSKSYILKKENQIYCGKFIAKDKHGEEKQLEHIQEFKILSKLNHKHIVSFVKCVQTPEEFCLITEYYPNKSMFELIQRRIKLTIYEVRFFCKQLLSALKYLQKKNIIHRDIKPQNMLLDQNMNLKLSDFGMAIICPTGQTIFRGHIYGTPNYISPEMITKFVSRYNHKVDIWTIGCFLYHMYIGKTPFRGKTEKMLYDNIQNCIYHIPSDVPQSLANLIQQILQREPDNRPNIRQILSCEFFVNGFTPNSLPLTALVEKPKFMVTIKEDRLLKKNDSVDNKYCENKCFRRCLKYYENYISQLIEKSKEQLSSATRKTKFIPHEIEYPMLDPFVWITHIVKNNKNIGYLLNDGTKGVQYEDKTILVLLPNHNTLYYVTHEKQIKFYTIFKHSDVLKEKVTILKSLFGINFNGNNVSQDSVESKDWLPILPYLLSLYETTKYYILLMSNGLYQIISKANGSKLLLCTKTSGFSVLSNNGKIVTYDLNSLVEFGYPEYLHKNLEVTYSSLRRILTKNECFACKKEIGSETV